MWVCSHKIWNLTSFAMDAKASCITSWDVVFSPPWVQWRRWISMVSISWPQM
jgi:hypothetical protein